MRGLASPRRASCAVVVLAAALLARDAAALPRLTVQRTSESTDCPDAAALADAVARQMGRPALDTGPLATTGYDVLITREGGAYAADILAQEKAGKIRHIDDPGDTCAGLADALALTLSILLDSANEPAEVAPPPPPVEPPPPPATRPEAHAATLALSAFGAFTAGVLDAPAGAFVGELELRPVQPFAAALGLLVLPGQTIDVPPGEVSLSLTAATLRACGVLGPWEGPRLSLCVDGKGGVLRATGSGFPENGSQSRPWLALGASAVGSGPIAGPLSWTARADLVTPLVRESFDVEGLPGLVYEPSALGGVLGAGLRLTIR